MNTTQTIRVTAAFVADVTALQAAGKTPWILINDDYAVGAYASRTEARKVKADENLLGVIVKASDVNIEVIDLAPPVKAKAVKAEEFHNITEAEHKAHRDEIEIIRKSEIESPCFVVWDTADKMAGARRKDVLAACAEKGIAFYTARTQYQLWLTSKKADEAVKAHKGSK